MAEQTKIWFHIICVAFSCPQRSASIHPSHKICDAVQPVHKRWKLLVINIPVTFDQDDPWVCLISRKYNTFNVQCSLIHFSPKHQNAKENWLSHLQVADDTNISRFPQQSTPPI